MSEEWVLFVHRSVLLWIIVLSITVPSLVWVAPSLASAETRGNMGVFFLVGLTHLYHQQITTNCWFS